MQKHTKLIRVVAAVAAMGLMVGQADAAVIQFEAESGTLGSDFATNPFAGALGGNVIADSSSSSTGAANVASYSVNFAEAGTYDLYVRLVTTASASADSFFVGTDLGVRDDSNFGNTAEWHNLNGWSPFNNAFNGIETVDGQVWASGSASQIPNETLIWVNLTANFAENISATSPEIAGYTVGAPGTLTFQIAGRETTMRLDAFAFGLTSERDSVVVDGSGNLNVIPEPASLALIGLGGMLMLRRRR